MTICDRCVLQIPMKDLHSRCKYGYSKHYAKCKHFKPKLALKVTA